MNKNNIFTTIKKELRSIFRDKKTMIMLLAFPLMITVLIFLFGEMSTTISGDDATKYDIGINYDLNSTEKSIMSELNLNPQKYEDLESMKNANKKGKISVYIYYDKDENLYTIYSNGDMNSSQATNNATAYLESYNTYLGDLEIKGEDLDPEVIYGKIKYEIKNTSGEELDGSEMMINMIMNIAFTYIIVAIAIASINMATTAIATEKENGTLETILTLPISASELMLGKYLATVIMGVFASIVGYIITITSLIISRQVYDVYSKFSVNVLTIILGIIICVVASFIIAAISLLATSKSKTYKEAQATGSVIQVLCLAPMVLSYLNVNLNSYLYLIPVLNHTNILMDIYSGNINLLNVSFTIISTIVYTVILLYLLIKSFKSEKVLFGA